MRHDTYAPLYRSTIGFDRLFQLLDQVSGVEDNGYPPYNIERLDGERYRITMAVAGFTKDDLKVDVKEHVLNVRGEKNPGDDNKPTYLHQGIASRVFERRFQLADHVEVVGADLKDGLLHIDLERNLPESMKPRTIAINAGTGETKQIEAHA